MTSLLRPALGCLLALSVPLLRAADEHPADQAEYFKHEYRRSDGKFYPHWSGYVGKRQAEYETGFNDGLNYAISQMPNDSAGTETRKAVNRANRRSAEYRIGFFAALEVYRLHQDDLRRASSRPPPESPVGPGK